MIASACLTLALVHLLVWWLRRDARDNLLFALSAMAAAAFAGCELWMMRAETPKAFGIAVRWTHVPAWAPVLSLVGFVWLYLRAGRLWLAWTVGGLRTLSLITVSFDSIDDLQKRPSITVNAASSRPRCASLKRFDSLPILQIYQHSENHETKVNP